MLGAHISCQRHNQFDRSVRLINDTKAVGANSNRPSGTLADSPDWRVIALVFVPFAFGYYLSYVFRTINALISSDLISDLSVDPADLGIITSVYFLAFALAQLPLGVVIDQSPVPARGPSFGLTDWHSLVYAGVLGGSVAHGC
jgi:MFS family permease